jgi:hypothetical protein
VIDKIRLLQREWGWWKYVKTIMQYLVGKSAIHLRIPPALSLGIPRVAGLIEQAP